MITISYRGIRSQTTKIKSEKIIAFNKRAESTIGGVHKQFSMYKKTM